MARIYLNRRYSAAKTIPGTRFHQFIPVSQVIIKTRHVSEDEEFFLEFILRNKCALILCYFPSSNCATMIGLEWLVRQMLKKGMLEQSSCIHLIKADHIGGLIERTFARFQIQLLLLKMMLHLCLLGLEDHTNFHKPIFTMWNKQ